MYYSGLYAASAWSYIRRSCRVVVLVTTTKILCSEAGNLRRSCHCISFLGAETSRMDISELICKYRNGLFTKNPILVDYVSHESNLCGCGLNWLVARPFRDLEISGCACALSC